MSGTATGRLAGARVLVTRSRDQAARLADVLRREGAKPVLLPAIRFEPPSDLVKLQAAVRRAADVTYLAFTSANGVRSFLTALSAEGRDVGLLRGTRVYAVGSATAAALREFGIEAEALPREERAQGLANVLLERAGSDAEGLLIGPEPGDAELIASLRAGGLKVEAVAAYRTVSGADPAEAAAVRAGGRLDAALFYSPSAVRGTLQALSTDDLRGARIVAVGPTTAEALRRAELPPDSVAPVPRDAAVVASLCRLWDATQREEG